MTPAPTTIPDEPVLRLDYGSRPVRRFEPLDASLVLFLLLAVVYVGFRVWDLNAYSLWVDEIFSLRTVRLPWPELFDALAKDKVHPPLFYILLKIWTSIGGESLTWLKLFPLVASLATIVSFYLLSRELRLSGFARNTTFALIAANTILIYFSQELRMYSLLVLFTVTSVWLFTRLVNIDSNRYISLLVLFLVNLLLVYTHYFGWLVVGSEGLLLLWLDRKKFIPFFLSGLLLLVCYMPWIYGLYLVSLDPAVPKAGIKWISPPRPSSLIRLFGLVTLPLNFRGSTAVRIALFLGPVLAWIWTIYRSKDESERHAGNVFWFLSALVLIPIVVVYFVSLLGPQSVWHQRYLIIVVVPFLLLVGSAVGKMRPFFVRLSLALTLAVFSLYTCATTVYEESEFTRVKWQEMVRELGRTEIDRSGPVNIYQFEKRFHVPIEFYVEEEMASGFRAIPIEDSSSITDDHFWIIFSGYRENLRKHFPIESLTQRGYRAETTSTYGRKGEEIYVVSFRK